MSDEFLVILHFRHEWKLMAVDDDEDVLEKSIPVFVQCQLTSAFFGNIVEFVRKSWHEETDEYWLGVECYLKLAEHIAVTIHDSRKSQDASNNLECIHLFKNKQFG